MFTSTSDFILFYPHKTISQYVGVLKYLLAYFEIRAIDYLRIKSLQ